MILIPMILCVIAFLVGPAIGAAIARKWNGQ